jgi:hypothetical protein
MSIEQQKLSLIEQIATLNDVGLIYRLAAFLESQQPTAVRASKREAGFGKGSFPFVAADFDDMLPPGFDDYLLPSHP